MSTSEPAAPARPARKLWAGGVSIFAATIMLVAGLFQFVEGLVTVVNGPELFVTTPNYLFTFNAVAWGWIHMIIGLAAAAAGGFIFTGNLFARSVGIALAALSALANFLWLPQYPLWGIVVIALDVVVIWGLTTGDLGEF